MSKCTTTIVAMSLIVIAGLGSVAAAEVWLEAALGRYPGAARIGQERLDLKSVADGVISRQAVYETRYPVGRVQSWYTRRLGLAPASALNSGDGCVWLMSATLSGWAERNLSVLLGPEPRGTRVVVNDSLRFWR
jgi:hypothetical protein